MTPLLPGAWIGILGGGQLGRMTAVAARRMGYHVLILDPTPRCPAGQVADRQIVASFDDVGALDEFAAQVAVVTLEFENVPPATVRMLEARRPTRPGAGVLQVCRDRLAEKRFLRRLNAPVAPFAPVCDGEESQASALAAVPLPALLKTATEGYDGQGQRLVRVPEELKAAHMALGGVSCILEAFVRFEREISVIVARDMLGRAITYDPAENVHLNGILDTSMVPAPLTPAIHEAARALALRLAQALDLVGVLAVELFVTADERLLVNELAPRPHNSGHWSIEACRTSQFEQHARVVVGAPVGATDLSRPAACANLLGDLWRAGEPRWHRLPSCPEVTLHLYGKEVPRPGRKMGHLTALADTAEEARERVLAARALL